MDRCSVDIIAARGLGILAGGALALCACSEVRSREGTCYLDLHCPDGQVCDENGLCVEAEPSPLDDGDFKLDVGTGSEPEIPATCSEALRVRTNTGCEFWAVDLPNAWLPSEPYSYDIAADQQFAVVVANVSASETATVSVYAADGSQPVVRAEVESLRTHTFDLPAMSVDPTRNGGGDAYRIESDVPITAYQFQPLDNLVPVYSNDASALLPSHVLENDYMAMTASTSGILLYPDGFEAVAYNAGAFVTAVAIEDGTDVSFYPTSVLTEGGWSGVRLDRGKQFTILSNVFDNDPGGLDPAGNLSGTRVIADKPIALFSGNVTTAEPIESDQCCADHVEHQMLPLVAWGYRYAIAPPPDPTEVSTSDPALRPAGAPDVLDAGQVATFQTADPVAVISDPAHPIAVGQFLLSSGEANAGGVQGDPAFVALPSVEQLQTRYVFLAPSGYATNAVNVVVPSGSTVEIDGEEVGPWTTIAAVDGEEHVYARHAIDPGAHVLIADAPAALTVFGYDAYVSYAYAGGSAVRQVSDVPPAP
jgi:hypothetical protein